MTLPTGAFTVDPRALTLAVNNGATRAYDGSNVAAASLFNLAGMVNGDSVSLGGLATLDSIHAGTRSVSSIGGLTLSSTNYTLSSTLPTGTVEVSKAAVTAALSVSTRAYDGTTGASVTASPVGGVAGDTLSFTGVTGVLDSPDAGSRSASVDVAGLAVTGSGLPSDYDFTPLTGQAVAATVTPKALTITGATVGAKVYDGTTAGSATGGTLSGLVGSETLVFTPTVTFTSANAGATAQVGATLADGTNGGKAGNYSVTLAADGTAITPRVVQAGKTYDGTSAFAGTDLVVQNLVAGDTVTATGSGTLSGAGVGTQTLASAGTLALSNGNYTLNGSSYLVLPRPVALTTVAGASRVYDATTDAGHALLKITNIVGSESVALSGTGTLAASGVGSQALVGVTGLTLTGAHAGNYTLVGSTPTGNVTITARPVSVAVVAGASRAYDGTALAGLELLQIGNLLPGDDVAVGGGATLASPNVGTQALTGLTALTLTGTAAGNYTLAGNTPSGSVTITARPVSVSVLPGASRVYDGTALAGVNLLQIGNLVAGDNVAVAGNATLASANAGTQAITDFSGLALTGTAAGNYTLTGSTPTGNVTITARPVTVSAIAGASRAYDGTAVAGLDLLQLSGVLPGEQASLTGSAALAGKGVGTQALSAGTLGLSNANYALAGSPTGSVLITPRVLQLSFTVADKVFDGTLAASVQATDDRIAGDQLALDYSAAFADTVAGSGKPVALTGLALGGADAGNYQLAGGAGQGLTGNLLHRPLTYTLASAEPGKLYTANGSDLVTPAQLDQLVLQSWANTVAGTEPGALAYTIWKDGQQVDAIRNAGVYEIRAQFAAQDAHYAIADSGNTVLQITVQDNAVKAVVAQAVRTLPAVPALTEAALPGDATGPVAGLAPNVVAMPQALAGAFEQGAALALVSAPRGGEASTGVTLTQARAMLKPGAGAATGTPPDVRVPLSRNSLAEIVNGGVRLPTGVDQLLFVVQAEE
ncbi:MAG: YDG domain-containing protein [Roseateles sp.]|uniref:beta strand repeat-containing protein n=1 Tax=Roseateles sp. TaxID=1971397 RepID=UPI0039E9DA45